MCFVLGAKKSNGTQNKKKFFTSNKTKKKLLPNQMLGVNDLVVLSMVQAQSFYVKYDQISHRN